MRKALTTIVALGLSFHLACEPVLADQVPCRTSPKVVAACFRIHGRLSIWNGTPSVRIWKLGTSRIFGVHDGNSNAEGEVLSAELKSLVAPNGSVGVEVFGDFDLCPLTKQRKGRMQIVCIESASHLVSRNSPP
ncbi:MAG: hypothetical protein HY243_16325 [Proteobacteria bacterium]|nr:hypothetical protein [Pseudomonadota bacterium]